MPLVDDETEGAEPELEMPSGPGSAPKVSPVSGGSLTSKYGTSLRERERAVSIGRMSEALDTPKCSDMFKAWDGLSEGEKASMASSGGGVKVCRRGQLFPKAKARLLAK